MSDEHHTRIYSICTEIPVPRGYTTLHILYCGITMCTTSWYVLLYVLHPDSYWLTKKSGSTHANHANHAKYQLWEGSKIKCQGTDGPPCDHENVHEDRTHICDEFKTERVTMGTIQRIDRRMASSGRDKARTCCHGCFVEYCVQSNFIFPWPQHMDGTTGPSTDLSPPEQWDALPLEA